MKAPIMIVIYDVLIAYSCTDHYLKVVLFISVYKGWNNVQSSHECTPSGGVRTMKFMYAVLDLLSVPLQFMSACSPAAMSVVNTFQIGPYELLNE